jgi:hypothetical protein
MIIDKFSIYNWEVTILYECTCDDIDYIIRILRDINCPNKYIKEALNNLQTCNLNIGLTYSNTNLQSSVIVVNKTSSFAQLINTIAHEYFHLICHISKILEIEDEEELAYLNGNLNMRSYNFVKKLEKEVGSE